MSKFNLEDLNLEDLILNEEDVTNPKTYTIKINKKFNDETLVNFSAAIITHYIKNKIKDSPEIKEVIINENLISPDDQNAIFYSLSDLFHYKNIENDNLFQITGENIRDCLYLLYTAIKGFYYEDYCKHLIYRIFEILKVKGYKQCDITLDSIKIQITESTNDKE